MLMGAQATTHPVRPCCLIIAFTLLFFTSLFTFALGQPDVAAQALLRFKSSLANTDPALANWNPSVQPCPQRNVSQGNWAGVLCYNGYVWGLQLENMNLHGQIDVDALAPLRFLRAFSVMNNKFEGPMPDWKKIGAIKSLYLSNNQFSGPIAEDAFKGMNSLKKVHMANNKFTGKIPHSLESPKLIELRLENNQFTGSIPAISSDFLQNLNVSNNQLEGPIPVPLAKLDPSSFTGNKALCGQPLGSCDPMIPPPNSEPNLHPSPPGAVKTNNSNTSTGKRTAIIVVCVLLGLFLLLLLIFFLRQKKKSPTPQLGRAIVTPSNDKAGAAAAAPTVIVDPQSGPAPSKKADHQQPGKLSFVKDDRRKFDLQDLMRASAEVLGSGNFGASYKAVLVDGEALVVKRFKQMNSIGREDFHEHMRRIGRLNHPNLLPLVAYLYRKEEKLLVFDHVHNGSLATYLHGKKTQEQSSLNWPSRLKIIKGVANGLLYLQTELPSLVVPHGHLKSSNVLLDKDFNPLLMDYTLVPIVNQDQVPQILVAYKSPEYAKLGRTSKKTDVWALGILILETITGKFVAKYLDQGSGPYGSDLVGWINEIVKEAGENNAKVFDKEMNSPATCKAEMEKLLQIGITCCKEEVDERPSLEEAVHQIEQV